MSIDFSKLTLNGATDGELAASFRDYLSDRAQMGRELISDIGTALADDSQIATLKTKWGATVIPIVNDGTYIKQVARSVQQMEAKTALLTRAVGALSSLTFGYDMDQDWNDLVVGSVEIASPAPSYVRAEVLNVYEREGGKVGVTLKYTNLTDSAMTVAGQLTWMNTRNMVIPTFDAEGACADVSYALHLQVSDLFDAIHSMAIQVEDQFSDDINEMAAMVYDEVDTPLYCTVSKVIDMLTQANQGIDVVTSVLDTFSGSISEVDPATLLTNFRSNLQSKTSSLTATGLLYFNNMKDIIMDPALAMRDKICAVLSTLTTGLDTSGEKPDNRLSDITGVSVWTAVGNVGQTAATVIANVGQVLLSFVTAVLGTSLLAAGKAAWQGFLAAVGTQDGFCECDAISARHFNKYSFRAKMPAADVPTDLQQRLSEHSGRFLTLSTPFGPIALKFDSTYVTMDILCSPVHPAAFDYVFGGISSQAHIYDLSPVIGAPTTQAEAEEMLDKLMAVANQSTDMYIGDDYTMWKGLWLSRMCLAYWIGCVNMLGNDQGFPTWVAYLYGMLTDGSSFTSVSTAADVTNLSIVRLLCGQSVSDPGYADITGNAYARAAFSGLFGVLDILIADPEQYYPYTYRVAFPVGRYTVYTDAALAAVGFTTATAVALAIGTISTAVVASKLKKAAYQKRTMAQAMSWECLDKKTGKLDPSKAKLLNKCRKQERKAEKVEALIAKISSADVSSALTSSASGQGAFYSAQRLMTGLSGGSVYTDEAQDLSLVDIKKLIAG